MARFRQSLRPINRVKHVFNFQQALPKGTQLPINFITSDDSPVLAQPAEVETASVCHAFYCTVEIVSKETSTTATPNIYLSWVKNPGNNLTFLDGNLTGTDDNKRYVFHQEMVMFNPTAGGVSRNLFKGVIKIPKSYKRNGPNDKTQLLMFIPSTGVDVNICGQFHYKEFR